MDIQTMMLQVLDNLSDERIIVATKYPDFSTDSDNAYFMIDLSDGGCDPKIDKNGKDMVDDDGLPIMKAAEIYDHWHITDSFGQVRVLKSNVELIEFFDSITDIIEEVWVEGF